jgi:hypothetical protein
MHTCHVWGRESPHEITEHRHFPKVSVWCALMKNKVKGPFFEVPAATGDIF